MQCDDDVPEGRPKADGDATCDGGDDGDVEKIKVVDV